MLTELIYKNPGIHFCELIRISGIKNGTLVHYTDKLESNGIILTKREKRKTRFYSPKISLDEIEIIKFLRKQTSKDIIFLLIKNNGLEFHEIVSKVEKSPSTISQNITKLIKSDLVIIKIDETKKKYFIKKNILIINLIKNYQFD
jgi:predicted transcriptional regulator